MTAIVRRINLLAALALLLSGLLQPLAAAQGVPCARTQARAEASWQTTSAPVDRPASVSDDVRVAGAPRPHGPFPQPEPASAPSAPCGVAALPAAPRPISLSVTARRPLQLGDLAPESFFIHSLFRPPRLS